MQIDQEVKWIVTQNYDRAREVLESHQRELEEIAEELLIREVLDADQVMRIARGETLTEPVETRDSSEHPPDGQTDRPDDEHQEIVAPVPSLDKAVPQE